MLRVREGERTRRCVAVRLFFALLPVFCCVEVRKGGRVVKVCIVCCGSLGQRPFVCCLLAGKGKGDHIRRVRENETLREKSLKEKIKSWLLIEKGRSLCIRASVMKAIIRAKNK